MSKAFMIIALAFWISFAYECEGALFFHHVAKSEVGKIMHNFAMHRTSNSNNLCKIGTNDECIDSKQGCTCGEDVCFVSKNFEIQIFKT